MTRHLFQNPAHQEAFHRHGVRVTAGVFQGCFHQLPGLTPDASGVNPRLQKGLRQVQLPTQAAQAVFQVPDGDSVRTASDSRRPSQLRILFPRHMGVAADGSSTAFSRPWGTWNMPPRLWDIA